MTHTPAAQHSAERGSCPWSLGGCVAGMTAAPSGSGQFDRLGVGLRVDMRARHCSVVGFLPDPLNLPLGTMDHGHLVFFLWRCWLLASSSCFMQLRVEKNSQCAYRAAYQRSRTGIWVVWYLNFSSQMRFRSPRYHTRVALPPWAENPADFSGDEAFPSSTRP